ncbi:MAG TPA: N-acetyl-gamma-glutamyl-phosphate reductase [Candidatus Avoscillospira avicola]|uniref:N-acetyl-gamma-glutamyl-phosphate reductase n=1 Tax=Candidatus Avoscillospira avicola TaxID=2840706 RepID=A0A9D1IVY6_9FIRM|nr:N-acetyl-gamma-glutamyl-phosphate reductase [Candidatus Avoscillospira avicola]
MKTVFIDGSAGTTGLRIHQRLAQRRDLKLLTLPESCRKDPAARRDAMSQSDAAFLCLPDDAAIEAADLMAGAPLTLLDTSTAHRTSPGWAYGFPELGPAFARAVQQGSRIAVPGCHASGFIALVRPLVEAGLLSPTARLSCHSVTGYSGGGKKMIAQYEAPDRDGLLDAPRQYALGQTHKHLKEMQAVCGLDAAPIFCPIVADFYSGMVVTVPLFREDLQGNATADHIRQLYGDLYRGPVVRYLPQMDEAGFLSGAGLSGRDSMELTVAGNDQRILLLARYDNLGKGASGAAIQCLNLSLGCDITEGLVL